MKRGLLLLLSLFSAGPAPAPAEVYPAQVVPLLQKYCADCHGSEQPKAQVNLETTRRAAQLRQESDLWYRVLAQTEAGKMPPRGEEQPTPEERGVLTGWIRGEYTDAILAQRRREGRSRLRRLTREEYACTLEDLCGVRPRVDLALPPDGVVNGYEKVSGALALSAEGARGYLSLAENLIRMALRPPWHSQAPPVVRAVAVESGESPGHSLVLPGGTVVSFNSDNTSGRLKWPGVRTPGRYHLRLSVYAYQAERPLPFGVYVGRTGAFPQEIELAEILEAPPGRPAVLEAEVYLQPEQGIRLIPFGLGVPVPKNSQARACRAPGLAVQWVEVAAPPGRLLLEDFFLRDFPPAYLPELQGRARQQPTEPAVLRQALDRTFQRVAARLFRREVSPAEASGWTREVLRQQERGATLPEAFSGQLAELLTAPEFLCLVEHPGPLSNYALASRLSYLLWNSAPDEALLHLARSGHLQEPRQLAEQADRLLRDPRAERFLAGFTDQWLGLRGIADTSPDARLYPDYGELQRFSSVRETRAFLRTCLAENTGIRDFVAARWSCLNEPLAQLYGLSGVKGLNLRKTTLPGFSPYGGLWTQSAILKVTANGTHTSPVKRGVWVSERLLGIPIAPPPPGVSPLAPDTRGARTLREELALHRRQSRCAACHAQFDPYGFALESFDVTGAFRTAFRVPDPAVAALPEGRRGDRHPWKTGLPVDCAGTLPDGRSFADITELRALLAAEPRPLAVGFVRHLLTYATGTPPDGADDPAVQAIVDAAAPSGYAVRTLLQGVIGSELFRCQ